MALQALLLELAIRALDLVNLLSRLDIGRRGHRGFTNRHPLCLPITLADLRTLLGLRPKASREKSTWQHVAAELDKAAAGADPVDVSVALQMVLSLEGVEFQPARSQLPNVRK